MTGLSRRFSARGSEFEHIMRFIDTMCTALGADERLRISLLVEELFANSIHHGYGGDSDQPVWLTLKLDDGSCRLTYEDLGPPYDPFVGVDSASATDGGVEERAVGGLGLVLLTELSSSRWYERRGDRNVIELDIPCEAHH